MENEQKMQQSNLNLNHSSKCSERELKPYLSYVSQIKARDTKKSTYCLVVVIERSQSTRQTVWKALPQLVLSHVWSVPAPLLDPSSSST
jgi:hypothetical protein